MSSTAAEHPDRGPTVRIVTCTVAVLATLFVLLRSISRGFIVRYIGSDDICMFVAWLIAMGMSAAIINGTSRGLGRHDDDIPSEWVYGLKRSLYGFTVLYNPALMASKTSILIFYLRLTTLRKFFRRASIACLVIVNAAGLALTLVSIFQCRPVANILRYPTPDNTQCTDIVTLYLSSAPVNILSDLAILFLPMPLLTSLGLPRKQKIILVATFGLGGFVAIVDVVRVAYLQEASTSRLLEMSGSTASTQHDLWQKNLAWYVAPSLMWSAVEVNVGIICACIPTLKALLSYMAPKFSNSAGSRPVPGSGSATSQSGSGSGTTSVFQRAHSDHNKEREGSSSSQKQLTSGDPSINHKHDAVELREIEFTPTRSNHAPTFATMTEVQVGGRTPLRAPVLDSRARRHPKSLVQLTDRESARPLLIVTVLFFLWGFAYGLLGALNSEFQTAVSMTSQQMVALHCVYFAAYFTSPLTFSYILLEKFGFKLTFITGLCIFATGSLVFWPSAILGSFPGFIVSNFIAALGLSTLEIAANPFISLCGPPEHAESRLNLAQAGQAVGAVVSPLVANYVLFRQTDVASLVDTQWTYLAVALFAIALAGFFYYYPVPEVSTDELEAYWGSNDTPEGKVGGMSVAFTVMIVGAIAQFGYVGGQETVSPVFVPLTMQWLHSTNSRDTISLAAIAHSLFVSGRLLAALVFYFLRIKAQAVLYFFLAGAVVTSIITAAVDSPTVRVALVLNYFFQSAIFPTTFVMALRGQGRRVKLSAAAQIVSIVSGAFVPAIQYAVGNASSIQQSLGVPAACYALALILPLYTTFSRAARHLVDPDRRPSRLTGDGDMARCESAAGNDGSLAEFDNHSQSAIFVEHSVHIESHDRLD